MKDWIFVSDAHFTGKKQGSEGMESFLQFLNSQKDRIGVLVILGDLFEFLFGFEKNSSPDSAFPFPDYLPVLRALRRLAASGVRIKYFEGNHDFRIAPFFRDWFNMEIEVYSGASEEAFGSKRSFIAHGDLSNPQGPGQWKYRFYRRVLKNPWTYRLIQWIGPRRAQWVASRMGHKSYEVYHARRKQGLLPGFHSFAHQKFLEGFDVVILAHSHFPERIEEVVQGKSRLYVNVGDWLIHRSYVRWRPPDHFELNRFACDSDFRHQTPD